MGGRLNGPWNLTTERVRFIRRCFHSPVESFPPAGSQGEVRISEDSCDEEQMPSVSSCVD